MKSRFTLSFNLRLPSMVSGKKGFDRLLWAAANVFADAQTWLFADLHSSADLSADPISKFQPIIYTAEAGLTRSPAVLVPAFPAVMPEDDRVDAEIQAVELLEWLTLAMLASPRVERGDKGKTDAYISRYDVPVFGDGGGVATSTDLVRLRWHGFLPAVFVAKVFSAAVKATAENKEDWFSLRVEGYASKSCTLLKVGGTAMTWECE